MDFSKTVTPEEQEYIQKVFQRFQDQLEEKIKKDVHDEMLLLSKYKNDTRGAYRAAAH
jgi:predicted transcriptional regulator YdeE